MRRRSESVNRALFFLALAILHTWPLASAPHRLSLNYNADAQLNAWIVTWIAHVLPTDPSTFWQGNIFQPGEAALSFSEPLIVPALAAAPIFWVSGSAVLTHNLLLIAGLALSGFVASRVITRWSGSELAGLLGGVLFVFNAHLLTRLPHLQAAHAWPLILMWGAMHARLEGQGRPWWLPLSVLLATGTSLHWLVFGLMGGGLMALSLWPERKAVLRVLLEGTAGMLAALPILWPYITGGLERPLEQLDQFAATPAGYLTSLSRLHQGWTTRFFTAETNVFFPGLLAIAAGVTGLIVGRRQPVVRWAAAVVVVGAILSFGPATPIYEWAYRAFPPLQGIRAVSRFGMFVLTGLAILAAFGFAAVERRLTRQHAVLALAASIVVVTIEQIRAPIRTEPFHGVPAVYTLLRDEPGPVLLAEMPFYPPDSVFQNGEYVLNATSHWRPVMNGYSGLTPLTYRQWSESLWYFPEPRAFAGLSEAGATHVMVHLEKFGPDAEQVARALDGHPAVRLIAADRDGHRLYRVVSGSRVR